MSQLTTLVRGWMAPYLNARKQRIATAPIPSHPALKAFRREDITSTSDYDWARLSFPGSNTPDPVKLPSSFATKAQLESPAFRYWCQTMRQGWVYHRKLWEYCYIVQALYERDMLRSGRRGLGFAVGEEPLPSLFASLGCAITATDLPAKDSRADGWAGSNQHAAGLAVLNQRGLCPEESFERLVDFQPVDMNAIPDDCYGYDFTWSSCSFEHCGSIDLGCRFIREQMKCLRPGGVAVHTTEFNLTSNRRTLDRGVTVLFRQRDIQRMFRELRSAGHTVEPILLDLGDSPEDRKVDQMPYGADVHLKLAIGNRYVSTSIGLIIAKRG